MQQNSRCRLSSDRDETINCIISECSKLAQKEYKTKHDWVGKVIHLELCRKLKFDHTNKWYMHKLTSVRENETQKLLWDFEIQTDHLISARWPDLIIINEKKRTRSEKPSANTDVKNSQGVKMRETESLQKVEQNKP